MRVKARNSENESDQEEALVTFVRPLIQPVAFPAAVTVTIPRVVPVLGSRQPGYLPPPRLAPFDDSFFDEITQRTDAEYVLSQAARIQLEIMEGDVELIDGEFRQVVLRDPAFGGAYSLWFTSPASSAAAGGYFRGAVGCSSLFHEMGHKVTLNGPAACRFGGRTDGNANAIFTEAVAQVFRHAVASELANHRGAYGIPEDLAFQVALSTPASARGVRAAFDTYVQQGMPFETWNDPATPGDETGGTFMTVARQFMVHAEETEDYLGALRRTMRPLRTFNADTLAQYAPNTNSPAASAYRATFLVAALSYGFQTDLREEFRSLGFRINDDAFVALCGSL